MAKYGKGGKGGNYKGMSQKMPNEGASSGSTTPMASNEGKSCGLKMEKGTNQGATKKPDTKNLFPYGMA